MRIYIVAGGERERSGRGRGLDSPHVASLGGAREDQWRNWCGREGGSVQV